jgi:hypothetical protein
VIGKVLDWWVQGGYVLAMLKLIAVLIVLLLLRGLAGKHSD